MKQKLAIIIYFLLLNVSSYSQVVLTDNNGDTLVAITLEQMDNIYVELIQKDSLMEQAIISSSKEAKLLQLVSITENNLKSCEKVLKDVGDSNIYLLSENKKKDSKLKRTRKVAISAIIFAALSILL
jgi:antitoxin component YwqK of YwqJK toxin-antitoxin module